MHVINLIKDYWVLISGILVPLFIFARSMIQASKCSLRNDILAIYEESKARGNKITRWELEAIEHSAAVYFALKGNSFVKDILNLVRQFELID